MCLANRSDWWSKSVVNISFLLPYIPYPSLPWSRGKPCDPVLPKEQNDEQDSDSSNLVRWEEAQAFPTSFCSTRPSPKAFPHTPSVSSRHCWCSRQDQPCPRPAGRLRWRRDIIGTCSGFEPLFSSKSPSFLEVRDWAYRASVQFSRPVVSDSL